jgi:hypothetical protein
MNRDTLASFPKEELIALIEALTKQISMLTQRVEALQAELGKPPKTPDNSSIPPSRGHKANGESETKPKAKAHAGSHRPLHPNPGLTHEKPKVDYNSGSSSFKSSSALREAAVAKPMIVVAEQAQLPERSHA